ncbi:MAG: hypothetical protein WD894_16170 [Pirellulales bacterium]
MKTLDEARDVLRSGGSIPDLAQAIGVLISDPTTSLDDLRLGLRYKGFVAEQAELAIERRSESRAREIHRPT